ncbi:hypothetical protein A3D72_00490 [Candidatus Uhrbacteria bacterium RIFCSPHIGHO2_02_FULL_57_19]|uniref:Uncharacterized protein n=1 Tax=Candidatus Uhrbacteria bacterium RIFCSPHIGHO2_02_FULL_57_19 TaxID=1802391 RepID=A0A1F7U377_9BACT|nr:MAG: hypothetical protein A3D72_00490 [Candidatus Uhrbacteria bacterium RIFCSPHIGHO2_02_FULL_57_19]
MTISKTLTTALILTALMGIGCVGRNPAPIPIVPAPAPAQKTQPTPAPAASTSTASEAPPPSPTSTPAETPGAAAPSATVLTTTITIDETWQTYSNAALNFEFKWPTRGRYAPNWEVRIISEGDSRMKDGCLAEGAAESRPPVRVGVGGVEFCHSSYSEGAAGTRVFTDHYATKNGSRYVAISFTKEGYSGSALGCSFDLSVNATTCIQFDEPAYLALLDQIVSTFRYKE